MSDLAKKKILAVASLGGHWIQLLRIAKGLEAHCDLSFCSTHDKCAVLVRGHKFYRIHDFSRWDAWRMPTVMLSMVRILRELRPQIVLTTGAAPGLMAIVAAKFCGVKSVWIDSIANVERLSASGRIARRLADRVYTQWPELASGNVIYAGNVFG